MQSTSRKLLIVFISARMFKLYFFHFLFKSFYYLLLIMGYFNSLDINVLLDCLEIFICYFMFAFCPTKLVIDNHFTFVFFDNVSQKKN